METTTHELKVRAAAAAIVRTIAVRQGIGAGALDGVVGAAITSMPRGMADQLREQAAAAVDAAELAEPPGARASVAGALTVGPTDDGGGVYADVSAGPVDAALAGPARVRLRFSARVGWLGLSRDEALALADALRVKAYELAGPSATPAPAAAEANDQRAEV